MVLARFQDYELASRLVLEQLGYELVNLDKFCCCGASLLPGVTDNWINLSAYTLALAEKSGSELITLCGNCTNNFKRANLYLEKDPKLREKTDASLKELGLAYRGRVKVRHIMEVLYERRADLKNLAKRKVQHKVALTHPCQVLRPEEIREAEEGIVGPETLKSILQSLDIEVVEYPKEFDCCGATALLFDEELALSQGKSKLESAKKHGAEALCAACGNCLYLLGRFQNKMFEADKDSRIPVLSVSQIAALALGYSEKELHIKGLGDGNVRKG